MADYDQARRMKFVLHRGLEELGKAIDLLTVLLLVVVLVGGPVVAVPKTCPTGPQDNIRAVLIVPSKSDRYALRRSHKQAPSAFVLS